MAGLHPRGDDSAQLLLGLKKNVIDALRTHRQAIFDEYGEKKLSSAFVQKRLDQVITDTVSLRKMSPIIRFAAQDARTHEDDTSTIDASIRALIEQPDATIDDAYEDTVQMMVEVDSWPQDVNDGRRICKTADPNTRYTRS